MFEKLDIVKPALKNLVSELRKKYAYASVLAVQDDSRAWRINRAGKRINNVGLGGGSGYVVRVFDQIGCAEYSFNEFSEEKSPKSSKQSTNVSHVKPQMSPTESNRFPPLFRATSLQLSKKFRDTQSTRANSATKKFSKDSTQSATKL